MTNPWQIEDHPLLASLPPETRRSLADAFEAIDVPAGRAVVTAGESGSGLHIVESGWLDVLEPDAGALITELGPGALIGELGFLRSMPHNATVRATTDAVVHCLSAETASALAHAHPGFALALGRVAAERVHSGSGQSVGRPRITAVVCAGDWRAVRDALDARLDAQPGGRSVRLDRWPDGGGMPGTAAHLAGTRALGAALAGVRVLFVWTGLEEPALSRALRSADRVIVLDGRDGVIDGGLLRRVVETPVDDAVDVVIASPIASELEMSGVSLSPMARVRSLRLPADEFAPAVLRELTRRGLVERMLSESPIFGALSATCRQDMERHFGWGHRPFGEVVYREGAPLGRLYLVLSGRVAERSSSGQRVDFLPGFIFGDDGLGGPRRAAGTATTVRDTSLAYIERSALLRVCVRHPSLRAALADQSSAAVARVRTAAISDRASIAVILPDRDPRWARRIEQLRAILGGRRRCAVIDRARVETAVGPEVIAAPPGTAEGASLRAWSGVVEERHRYLLHVAHRDDIDWLERCMGQTDHLLLVADGHGDPAVIDGRTADRKRHLALWWPADGAPQETARWLARDPQLIWHHVREDRFGDLGRLVRRMLGRAFGLVLGGASTRCIAHLGVAAAARDCDLPFDTAAGTSSGSAVAAVLCMQLGPEETLRLCLDGWTGFKAGIDNVGPPLVSFFSGRAATRKARTAFADAQIEDLVIPLKVTAVDLRSGSICVLDRGPIWRAVRASCSVPGLWPPVAIDGKLLVDGGLSDNFPYFVLEEQCAGGVMVVSNLDAGYSVPFDGSPDYGAVLSGWRVAWDRLLRRGVVYPGLASTVIECLVLGGRAGSAELEDRVDPRHVLITRPPIPKLDLFGLQRGPIVAELISVAHQATTVAIERWRALYGAGASFSTVVPVLDDETAPPLPLDAPLDGVG